MSAQADEPNRTRGVLWLLALVVITSALWVPSVLGLQVRPHFTDRTLWLALLIVVVFAREIDTIRRDLFARKTGAVEGAVRRQVEGTKEGAK